MMRRSARVMLGHLQNAPTVHCVRLNQTSSYIASDKQWRPELVVIDQYGTLINIHTAWEPWVSGINQRLEHLTGLPLRNKVYRCLDICQFTRKVRHGILGCGTTHQIKQTLEKLLRREGLTPDRATGIVAESWQDYSSSHQHLHKTKQIFEDLKNFGSRVAVCSSADRRATIETLEESGVIGLVDHVTCGDDAIGSQKSRVTDICRTLDVNASETVVIGDGICDMQMGRHAGVALNIGVLSGIGTRLDLNGFADIVTDDIIGARDYLIGVNNIELDFIKANRKQPLKNNKASLVIFDKDGTLLCFHTAWMPFAYEYVERLEAATGLDLHEKVLVDLGYCFKREKWIPAVFAQGTTKQCKESVAELLMLEGYDRSRAMEIADVSWPGAKAKSHDTPEKSFDHPAAIFSTLRSNGIKVAVCTSDCRHSTERFLKQEVGFQQRI